MALGLFAVLLIVIFGAVAMIIDKDKKHLVEIQERDALVVELTSALNDMTANYNARHAELTALRGEELQKRYDQFQNELKQDGLA
ncbi:hypothetical protein N5J31_01900 [Acinetobacter johnsonii]|jgi:hypothetical protein|uniref:hypothetical protein n=1 Tax=Acinetobacter johnsonii TaxID=40214 RepID=UPI0024481359|nr:hypothetical protein [Acinetobacter johnsonii]MDH2045681.1 hypothetical protein [Acinetobacter johnsonii]